MYAYQQLINSLDRLMTKYHANVYVAAEWYPMPYYDDTSYHIILRPWNENKESIECTFLESDIKQNPDIIGDKIERFLQNNEK